jgi:hypothetical protein
MDVVRAGFRAIAVVVISIIGVPLLLLCRSQLFLVLMAVVGLSGTASAVGQWTRRRFDEDDVEVVDEVGILIVCCGSDRPCRPFGGWTVSRSSSCWYDGCRC